MSNNVFILSLCSSACVFASVSLAAFNWAPYWDQLANKQMGVLADQFDRLGLDKSLYQLFLRIWGISLIAVGLMVGVLLRMPPVAIALVMLTYVAPRHILDVLIRRRTRILRDQLVSASIGVGNAAQAGLSLPQCLAAVCDETPKPLGTELQRIVFEYRHGKRLPQALGMVRNRLRLESFTLFSLAIEATHEQGGRLQEALQRISRSLQESQRLERKLEAETSAGKQTVVILGCFPGLFLLVFQVLDGHSTSLLYSNFSGQCVLAAVIGLTYAGSRWAAGIMRIEL